MRFLYTCMVLYAPLTPGRTKNLPEACYDMFTSQQTMFAHVALLSCLSGSEIWYQLTHMLSELSLVGLDCCFQLTHMLSYPFLSDIGWASAIEHGC